MKIKLFCGSIPDEKGVYIISLDIFYAKKFSEVMFFF